MAVNETALWPHCRSKESFAGFDTNAVSVTTKIIW